MNPKDFSLECQRVINLLSDGITTVGESIGILRQLESVREVIFGNASEVFNDVNGFGIEFYHTDRDGSILGYRICLSHPDIADVRVVDVWEHEPLENDQQELIKKHLVRIVKAWQFKFDSRQLEPNGDDQPIADQAREVLSGIPLRLFEELASRKHFVTFDSLNDSVWSEKGGIGDAGIAKAIKRMRAAIDENNIRYEIQLEASNRRVKMSEMKDK